MGIESWCFENLFNEFKLYILLWRIVSISLNKFDQSEIILSQEMKLMLSWNILSDSIL